MEICGCSVLRRCTFFGFFRGYKKIFSLNLSRPSSLAAARFFKVMTCFGTKCSSQRSGCVWCFGPFRTGIREEKYLSLNDERQFCHKLCVALFSRASSDNRRGVFGRWLPASLCTECRTRASSFATTCSSGGFLMNLLLYRHSNNRPRRRHRQQLMNPQTKPLAGPPPRAPAGRCWSSVVVVLARCPQDSCVVVHQ